ncbi:5-dehydro-4-deoxyglucarate dehydratase, partial [Rhizobium ruizarguesonis]|jgi:5-dehydro-4-deoxyglucarate dehydratase
VRPPLTDLTQEELALLEKIVQANGVTRIAAE